MPEILGAYWRKAKGPPGLRGWQDAPASRTSCPCTGCAIPHHEPAARANVHPKVASERAGHSSVGFTWDRYSQVIPSLQADAALRIDAALRHTLRG
jgi:hypothetical protein